MKTGQSVTIEEKMHACFPDDMYTVANAKDGDKNL